MERPMVKWLGCMLVLAGCGIGPAEAGFRTPESLVRNVYAYYGDHASPLSSGLPHTPEVAAQFFDRALQQRWIAAQALPYDFLVQSASWRIGAVTITVLRKQFDKTYVAAGFTNNGRPMSLNFIAVHDDDGWVIDDVESPQDSLRAFLAQYSK